MQIGAQRTVGRPQRQLLLPLILSNRILNAQVYPNRAIEIDISELGGARGLASRLMWVVTRTITASLAALRITGTAAVDAPAKSLRTAASSRRRR